MTSDAVMSDRSSQIIGVERHATVLYWHPFYKPRLRQPREVLKVEVIEAPSELFNFVWALGGRPSQG